MNDYITGQRAHRRTLAAEYERAKEALRLARRDLREARAERIATVAGEVEGGDAGIAWTNEERAEADVSAAEETRANSTTSCGTSTPTSRMPSPAIRPSWHPTQPETRLGAGAAHRGSRRPRTGPSPIPIPHARSVP